MNARQRALLEPAFLLHHRPWSDTSRILELVTRDHGRLTLFARGARRANSALRAVLLPFQPILVSWSGRADGGNLVSAELDGVPAPLPPARTLSAFYLSELMLRLTPRDEGQPEIFAAYASAIAALKSASAEEPVLRLFERQLLDALGYGVDFGRDASTGEAVDPAKYYHFRAEHGCVPASPGSDAALGGAELQALAEGRLDSPAVLRAARRVLREALDSCLDGRALKSRDVMLALRRRE